MEPARALNAWRRNPRHRSELYPSPDNGLINRTFLVGSPPTAVLQWVNPIFDPRIHLDIAAVTQRLAELGQTTPRLVPCDDGSTHVEDDDTGGFWRLLTFVPGTTVHTLASPRQAAAAGALVGGFHAAMAGWGYRFQAPQRRIHDTPARMADLRSALDSCDGHPLADPARDVGRAVLDSWGRWDGELDLPERPCHGDLKISNLRFSDDGVSGVALIDLDTLGPQALAVEMGDAWRSWCNPAGEEDPDRCVFDLELFTAAAAAWRPKVGALTEAEESSLAPGIERLCLELAARFCADAVNNSYFREDRERYCQPGAQNLLKARCQLRLAASARNRRSACEAVLRKAAP
ncbi:MAG: aminoglycoside phosphotransferase family protein [Acidobacteriota bacterium]